MNIKKMLLTCLTVVSGTALCMKIESNDNKLVALDYEKIYEDLKQGDMSSLKAALIRDDFNPNTRFTTHNNRDGSGKLLTIHEDTLFIEAAALGNIKAMKLLVDANADFRASTKEGWTGLHAAATHNQVGAAKYLLELTAYDPTFIRQRDKVSRDEHGATALQAAKYFEKSDVSELLAQYE